MLIFKVTETIDEYKARAVSRNGMVYISSESSSFGEMKPTYLYRPETKFRILSPRYMEYHFKHEGSLYCLGANVFREEELRQITSIYTTRTDGIDMYTLLEILSI